MDDMRVVVVTLVSYNVDVGFFRSHDFWGMCRPV
jgi:hypothetical protein